MPPQPTMSPAGQTTLIGHTVVDSPIGPLTLVGRNGALRALYMGDLAAGEHRHAPDPMTLGPRRDAGLDAAAAQLEEYFAGTRQSFELRLEVDGTPFQREVWAALARIPYGATRTYGQLAAEIGRPQASRAVGMANGRNPMSIVVPCHRVIGASGALTGYGGGIGRKAALLAMEQAHCGDRLPL